MMSTFVPVTPISLPCRCISRHAVTLRRRPTLPVARRRHSPLRPLPHHQSPTRMQNIENNPPDSSSGANPPDGATLTQALEVSFRNVWIRLMTSGIGRQYDDAIAAFVISTMAAYKAGYSINALKFELSANERSAKVQGIDVSLNDQEKQTRLIWIVIVYLTLATTNLQSERPIASVSSQIAGTTLSDLLPGLTSLVDSIRHAERKGYNLQTFKMEMAMQANRKSPPSTPPSEDAQRAAQAQANIRSQWSRIIFCTLRLLPDALKR